MQLRGIPSGNALAKECKVSQRTISSILAVDEFPNPSIKVLTNIAKALNVQAWMLLIDNFPFESIGLTKPLQQITAEGYRLLHVFENVNNDTRKSILDYALYQMRHDPKYADRIQEIRGTYSPTAPIQ